MLFRRLPPVMSLRAFEAVARHGSFKDAAEELSVTPGALSQQVKKLEDLMGVVLLLRSNRKISTTVEGEKLKLGLVESFNLMRHTVDSIATEKEAQQLLITCDPPFASKWLAQRLPGFLNHHLNFDVRVKADFGLENDHNHKHDVGIRFGDKKCPAVHHENLGREVLLAVASPEFIARNHLKEPRDILRVPILTEESLYRFPSSPTWKDWFDAAGIAGGNFKRGLNFGNHAEQAIDAAVSGGGVLFTRRTLVSFDLALGRLDALFGIKIDTPYHYSLVCSPDKIDEHKVGLFMDWLKSAFYEQQLL